MVSDKFRRQLRQEAKQWQADGLIDARQYQQLAEKYQFQSLDTAARDRFVGIVVSLGSILLGFSAITFVAANWQVLSRELKLLLLLGLFVGVNIAGFYLYRKPSSLQNSRGDWQPRLGQSLLLLGALILGANLALIGQIFHSGSTADLGLLWGLGVLLMAYSLRLTSLGVLAILLIEMGYWNGIQELYGVGLQPGLQWMLQQMPLLAGALFIPLAYWCRSRSIFVLAIIAILSAFEVVLTDLNWLFETIPAILITVAFVLPPALLWSYDDTLWHTLLHRFTVGREAPNRFSRSLPPDSHRVFQRPFAPLSQTVALLFLIVLVYVLSFHYIWQESQSSIALPKQVVDLFSAGLPFLLNPNTLILLGLTLVQWVYLTRPSQLTGRRRLSQRDSLILLLLVTIALVTLWHWGIAPIAAIATFTFNLLSFLMATWLIRRGLAEGQRRLFWSGMLALTLQILSRMLEYDTGLLFKSLVFLLCGLGVIGIGLWFERHLRTLSPAASFQPSRTEE
jgi:uncharacterized membrane protein